MSLADLFQVPQIEPKGARVVANFSKFSDCKERGRVLHHWMDALPGTVEQLADRLDCHERKIRGYIAEALLAGTVKQSGMVRNGTGRGLSRYRKVWARV